MLQFIDCFVFFGQSSARPREILSCRMSRCPWIGKNDFPAPTKSQNSIWQVRLASSCMTRDATRLFSDHVKSGQRVRDEVSYDVVRRYSCSARFWVAAPEHSRLHTRLSPQPSRRRQQWFLLSSLLCDLLLPGLLLLAKPTSIHFLLCHMRTM